MRRRDLDPYRVWYRSGALYAIGHDHLSRELRTFAIDRILGIEATDRRFEVPESFDFDAMLGAAFGVVTDPDTQKVRVRFEPAWASFVAERTWHPSQRAEPRSDGGLELFMEVAGLAEVKSWVLSFGASARVLEPERLRREVEQELAKALRAYR